MLMFTNPAIPIAITTSIELEAEDAPLLLLGRADDAVLGERGVEVDDVRHHRRAEDPDREQDALRALEAGHEPLRDLPPGRRIGEEHLRRERDHDHADERGDHGLEPAEAARLQREDRERGGARDQRRREERDAEQEVEADRRADELGEVGRHRDHLGLEPEPRRSSCAGSRSRQTSGRFIPVAIPSFALIDWITIPIRFAVRTTQSSR